MLVTINTDASFSPGFKIGAYAFWISCNEGPIKQSGLLKGEITGSIEAEIKCIANAIYALQKSGIKATRLIINTDCMHGIRVIETGTSKGKTKKVLIEASNIINELLSGKYSEVSFRHVKAHNGTSDKRSYVNDWCDNSAKTHLRQKIYELRQQKLIICKHKF